MPKLGCSPLMLGLLVAILALAVVGFISGALGSSLLGEAKIPFLSVARPHPELPTEAVFHISGFPVTNTILASWITILFLFLLSFFATRRMKLVPRGLQNALEWPLEMLYNFVEGVAGKENGRRFFPLVATIFLFVIMNAWLSLLPGFGTIVLREGEHVVHLLRGANTDINLPLALALVSFVAVEFWGIRSVGFFRYASLFVNVRNLLRGRLLNGFIDLFVGVLELVSHLVRILSFTFRLFGNMTAGEILLLIAFFLIPLVMALPFYALELLVGFVQALIFAGLTLVFAVVAVSPHEAEGEHA